MSDAGGDAQTARVCALGGLPGLDPTAAPSTALRAGGIRALATLCEERRDGDPRGDASPVRVGVRPLETRARHLGSWRL